MPVQLISQRKSSVSAHIPSSIKDPPVLSSPKADDTHTHTHTHTPHSGNSPVHTHTALEKLQFTHTHHLGNSPAHTHTSLGKLSSSHTHHSGNSPVHTHTTLRKLSSSHTYRTRETPVHTHITLGKLSSSHTHHTRETLQLLRPCCARMMNACKSHTLSFFPVCCLAKFSPITKACLLTIPQV